MRWFIAMNKTIPQTQPKASKFILFCFLFSPQIISPAIPNSFLPKNLFNSDILPGYIKSPPRCFNSCLFCITVLPVGMRRIIYSPARLWIMLGNKPFPSSEPVIWIMNVRPVHCNFIPSFAFASHRINIWSSLEPAPSHIHISSYRNPSCIYQNPSVPSP